MEHIKYSLAQNLISEEELRTLSEAGRILSRLAANAIPVVEIIPDPVAPDSCLGDRGKLRLNGSTEP